MALCLFTEGADGKIKVAVIDNGIGFCAKDLESILIHFYTTKEKGSGIGLSLSRPIMRLHEGSISARSNPRVETIFELVI